MGSRAASRFTIVFPHLQPVSPAIEAIRLKGVRQNNLKGFDLGIPLGRLTVVTGLSGAGKSSLVFETLHAEGQRRYVETFSPYTRQFMEMLDRPKVDSVENIRPSIAIEQSNTVKTSRSTVGTMTELCDYFKVWFQRRAQLIDPDTGEVVEDGTPQGIVRRLLAEYSGRQVIIAFAVRRPGKLTWAEILEQLAGQGFTRLIVPNGDGGGHSTRVEDAGGILDGDKSTIHVVQDRLTVEAHAQDRLTDAVTSALHFGQEELQVFTGDLRGDGAADRLGQYCEGLRSPVTGRRFRRPTPALFSFNSPLGACPKCRGFGRVIEIDYRLVLPDHSLSIADGVVRAFGGEVYSESQRDLLRGCRKNAIRTNVPWRDLSDAERQFVMDGEPGYGEGGKTYENAWYGVRRFFEWLESQTYKMHVRVFLSKYRAYIPCGDCGGTRLQPEALLWHWRGLTLPQLYQMPVSDLHRLLSDASAGGASAPHLTSSDAPDLAEQNILSRLAFLDQVGLGYLTLDRASRTLSGGEVERVNLTSCLGTGLVDTLFVLDEPSVGLHARDIDRLVRILRRLTEQGNTVVVVEHDESVMRAADQVVEIGPRPGREGGRLVYAGPASGILTAPESITGAYLSGKRTIDVPHNQRTAPQRWLTIEHARKHNIRDLSLRMPLGRFVALAGVSGSGKSTLLNNVIYQGLLAAAGKAVEDPAEIAHIDSAGGFSDIVLVDQGPISRTPRSNAVLFAEAWDPIRNLFAGTPEAKSAGWTAQMFSFNAGAGRCPHCEGVGYERIEMQFMADLYVKCPICEGRRFRPETLALKWRGESLDRVLEMTVTEAIAFFKGKASITSRLKVLEQVGLGYLPLGQPLNTLSGGESQRLKLVRYLGRFGEGAGGALLLLDEPTTGLHREDVRRLLTVLQALVDAGHSLVVIEHHLDILKSADWLIEMGPEAGAAGGAVVYQGPPVGIVGERTVTAPFLEEVITDSLEVIVKNQNRAGGDTILPFEQAEPDRRAVAEAQAAYGGAPSESGIINYNLSTITSHSFLRISGARHHNLRNLSLDIPHRALTVVTGVSGSGKSSLAFDIVFAEGQRRFMESMSPWARQYVEQLPRPEVDWLRGIPPTVAIEQRVTQGTSKSTVATVTEVSQYLRLLYARVGVQHSPHTGEALVAMKPGALVERLRQMAGRRTGELRICAPLIRGRKGHHEPMATWASDHGYKVLRIDGKWVPIDQFKRLDRYKEHDIETVVATASGGTVTLPDGSEGALEAVVEQALKVGKGAFFVAPASGEVLSWFSTNRADPVTGEAFPDLDPKHFTWNSARGWCPVCHGHGELHAWMREVEGSFSELPKRFTEGQTCPGCSGTRLNAVAMAVYLYLQDGRRLNLPELLALTPGRLLEALRELQLDARGEAVMAELMPEIEQRLKFMTDVGLDYLNLDRSAVTLSGGEAQRIRLAAQLGSNLSGVLYVLDEPSIGLHARDSLRLIESLHRLKGKGNTLLVVEHDDDIMREADHIVDLGPGAGVHGGEILGQGRVEDLLANPASLTGRYLRDGIRHPLRGKRRKLPAGWTPRTRRKDWVCLQGGCLRNLKDVDLYVPRGRLTVVCGISGAGKSTLVRDLLVPALTQAVKADAANYDGGAFARTQAGTAAPPFRTLRNGNIFRSVIEVDQAPIGKTPRSTPATYIGAFDLIRQFFGTLPEARLRGLTPGTFSFNTKGGRCETCKGAGIVKLEMAFMPDTYVECDDCGGSRYGADLADICWKGKDIGQLLDMTFEEAAGFFDFHPRMRGLLDLMVQTGLGYLKLGQSSPTLSGGEAQRLKLVSELAKGLPTATDRARGTLPENFYVLEEPTIGLHLSDCERLIDLLHRMVDQGHTVVVIEHHLDIIAEADYVVEIGPEGGEHGGEIIYQGDLPGLLKEPRSATAPFLKRVTGMKDAAPATTDPDPGSAL